MKMRLMHLNRGGIKTPTKSEANRCLPVTAVTGSLLFHHVVLEMADVVSFPVSLRSFWLIYFV